MPASALDENTALVLIDLQCGLADVPFCHPFSEVVANAGRLAEAFREAKRPVVLVRVDHSPDGATAIRARVDRAIPIPKPAADAGEIVPGLRRDSDILVTKRQMGAFHGTDLDTHLRRRGVTGLVLGGVATSIGVESTARGAADRAYNVTIASDSISDPSPDAHRHSTEHVFPLIAEVATTDEILALV